MIYPLIVAVVAFAFAAILLNQYRTRGKPHQVVWTIALALGGLAALSYLLFLVDARSPLFFRLYYISGGLLMAAYLGLGEVYLLASRRIAHWTAAVVVAASVIGLILVLTAHVSSAALHGSNILAGTKIIEGPAVVFVAVLNTFGAVAVIGGAAWSA